LSSGRRPVAAETTTDRHVGHLRAQLDEVALGLEERGVGGEHDRVGLARAGRGARSPRRRTPRGDRHPGPGERRPELLAHGSVLRADHHCGRHARPNVRGGTFLRSTLPLMADESLWRSRLRWRTRGALLWPMFGAADGGRRHHARAAADRGEQGMDLVPALLLAGFFNLLVVAVIGPLTAVLLRRRRPDLPRFVAQDYTGRIGLVAVTLALLAGGLVHRPQVGESRRDFAAQLVAAQHFLSSRAPAGFRENAAAATTLKLDEDLFRTCAPGPDPKRWFCVLVRTDTSPPGITVDDSRESNASLNGPGGFR
jgi:hypothetical protein